MRKEKISRRSVLKATSGAGFFPMAGYLDSSTNTTHKVNQLSSDLYLGKVHFVESVITHEGVERKDGHIDRISIPYVVEPDRISLSTAPVRPFRQNFVFSFRGGFYQEEEKINISRSNTLTIFDSFGSANRVFAKTKEEYRIPSFTVHRNNNKVIIDAEREQLDVSERKIDSIRLSPKEVKLSDGSEKTAKPVIRVRNHGLIDVFGYQNHRVLPLDSDLPWVAGRVRHFKNAAQSDPHVSIEEKGNFLVIYIDHLD